ncbi:MAG TPA: ABC transporter permease [Fimbriiglobus sp.]|nr:ABC transporter permease [Fimbriiglobus sp.]
MNLTATGPTIDGRSNDEQTGPAPGQATLPGRVVIEPPNRWEWVNLSELWRYRELLYFLTWRDVKVRYKQTALGAAWAILQPALMMVVFTIFFGRLAGVSTGGIPQPLFFLTGVLPWFFFSTAVSNAANSVVGSERLITKIYFPRLAVPFATVLAAAVDFVVAGSLLLVVMVGYAIAGYPIALSWQLAVVPVAVAVVGLTATGLGTLLAALNVAYRDVRYVVPFFIQIGMFATPAIYMRPTGNEGRAVEFLMAANPMNSLIEAFRAGLLGGPIPWAGLGVAAVGALVLLAVGCLYFRKVEDRFADIV